MSLNPNTALPAAGPSLAESYQGERAERGFWEYPWGYPQVVTVAITAVGIGLIVQTAHPTVQVSLPDAPWNWILVFGPLLILGLLYRILPHQAILQGLGGIPMAVVSVGAMALMSVPGAIWPQGAEAPDWAHRIGFAHVFSSFGMAAAMGLVLINLALCTIKRIGCWGLGDIRFLLIHGGLLLTIGGAAAGTGSLKRIHMSLVQGENPSHMGFLNGELVEVPFALQLHSFNKTTFPPTMSLAIREAEGENKWRLRRGSVLMEEGAVERIESYRIEVREYFENAAVIAGEPRAFQHPGTGPAGRIEVYSAATGESLGQGWLHSRTEWGEELFLRLTNDEVLIMEEPRAQSYSSNLTIFEPGKEPRHEVVAVNEPLRVPGGWFLYQYSYDSEAGTASRLSVIEAVRDPAYPVVALGCWLVIIGCTWFVWMAARPLRQAGQRDGSLGAVKGVAAQ